MEATRSGWFPCSCCPTNVVRLIPSIPGYVYAQKDNNVYVNLFISGNTTLNINNKPVEIVQQNNYPWDGDLNIQHYIQNLQLHLICLVRIPGWAQNKAMPSDLYQFENTSR